MAEGQKINPKAVRQCVQCLQDYKEEENADDSCKFHLLGTWGGTYQCCKSKSKGCCSHKHHSKHHTDWKYGEFLTLVRSIQNSTNNSTQWTKIEAQDLEHNISLYASIGCVLPRAPQWKNHLYIQLNSYWNFRPFSIQQIQTISSNATDITTKSDRVLISEITDDKTKAVIKAEWAFDKETNAIYGVYLTIRTQTCDKSECALITFSVDQNTLRLDGIEPISTGSFTEYRPTALYHDLIDDKGIQCEGAELRQNYDAKETQKRRKNIKPKCHGVLAKKLAITQKKFICNERFSYSGDCFVLELQFMNKTADSDFVFTGIEGIYQLVGDTKWSALNENESVLKLRKYKPEGSFYLNETESLPFNVSKERGATQLVQLEIFIPFEFNQQPKPASSWFSKSFLARHRPVNFQFKFEDIDDACILLQTQFITDLHGPSGDSNDVVFSMPGQDCLSFEHIKCRIELTNMEERNVAQDTVDEKEEQTKDRRWNNFEQLKIVGNGSYNTYQISDIRSMVYKAMKKKQNVIELDTRNLNKDNAKYNVFAYIDPVCQRLYAIKMVLTTKSCRKTGVYVLPIYGTIHNVEEKEPSIVSDDDESKYFEDKENAFAIHDMVSKYYNVSQTGQILIQKCMQREVDVEEFRMGCDGDDDEKESGLANVALLNEKIQEQAKLIAKLRKQLTQSGGKATTDNNAMDEWTNNVANKFEEIAQIFRAYPGT